MTDFPIVRPPATRWSAAWRDVVLMSTVGAAVLLGVVVGGLWLALSSRPSAKDFTDLSTKVNTLQAQGEAKDAIIAALVKQHGQDSAYIRRLTQQLAAAGIKPAPSPAPVVIPPLTPSPQARPTPSLTPSPSVRPTRTPQPHPSPSCTVVLAGTCVTPPPIPTEWPFRR